MSFLQISKPLGMIGLQTDDTLISADKVFDASEEDAICSKQNSRPKIVTASLLLPQTSFNGIKIELQADGDITLRQKSCMGDISLIQSHDASSTSAKDVVRTKLSPKEQYVAQQVRGDKIAYKGRLVFETICTK